MDEKLKRLRGVWGAKWALIALLAPLCIFGMINFGGRSILVLSVPVITCMSVGILVQWFQGKPYRLLHPGSIITGLLIGLTCTAETPVYMLITGAVVGEFVAKHLFYKPHRILFNAAVLGRTAIAALEMLDTTILYGGVDGWSGASVLFKEAGGHARPVFWKIMAGFTKGSIGETNSIILILIGLLMFRYVIIKKEAAIALILAAPALILMLPVTPEIVGHAPWVGNPVYYLFGGSTLLTALFFATDPATTPNRKIAGIIFGIGVAVIGVLGKLYTSILGAEMYGILIMNLFTPVLEKFSSWINPDLDSPDVRAPSVQNAALVERADSKNVIFGNTPSLDAYQAESPFRGFSKLLNHADSKQIFELLKTYKLNGCGGAHFPVHLKWEYVMKEQHPRYLLVNALEGEPRTFKDHYLLTYYTDVFIEGVAIASWAIQAKETIIVLNATYRKCLPEIEASIRRFTEQFGNKTDISIRVLFGPDPELYVCGEETALINYLNTGKAEPQPRPPFPAQCGYKQSPTLVQNVETLTWLPLLCQPGNPFENGGTPKLTSISGKVHCPGVYEVRLGDPISSIIDKAGHMQDGESLLGIAIGGTAGGILPVRYLDTAFSVPALNELGIPLGTGTIHLLSEKDDLVLELKKNLAFFQQESCQRCTPCRTGTKQLVSYIDKIFSEGITQSEYSRIRQICDVMQLTSTCGLGKGAPNVLYSIFNHWSHLFTERLIEEKPVTGNEVPIFLN
ncbi:MAG: hypothetical protein GY751_08890 [Bacteroidetes bacterium]|nr:hypothetical protein [Bacteroidota bacterium]